MPSAMTDPVPLRDRYLQRAGRVHFTGIQALVRIVLDQVHRDREAGHRVGALFSGYPGSPLAGLDRLLFDLRDLLEPRNVYFEPGLNEELAAGAVSGTQLVDRFGNGRYDGALGIWFGKAPGLDRALDMLRHSNYIGTARLGGALALVGDDPTCKSSSLPSHSETALAHAYVPTFYPSAVDELLALGRVAFALSRYAGVWCALKIVPEVADGGMIVELPEVEPKIVLPTVEVAGRPFEKRLETFLLAPRVNEADEHLVFQRLEVARALAYANGLDPIVTRTDADTVGIIAAGRLYRELRSALDGLGLDLAGLRALGVRLLKVQMLYPQNTRRLHEMAHGLREIVVVDERRGFLEEQVRAALYGMPQAPRILGQRDPHGRPWLPRHTEITSGSLRLDLGAYLARTFDRPELGSARADLERRAVSLEGGTRRTPHFCSGCPHNRSTRVPSGSLAGGGIGCHTMALIDDGSVEFINAMGSEGSQWIGLSRFVERPHLFQNVGDGTYFHSGRLALRACVEAGVQITFRILYNAVIGMTGGQTPVGIKSVDELIRELLGEGVARVVAISDDAAVRRLAAADSRVAACDREDYDDAMRELRDVPGVTVLIYDQVCANQKARMQKRGTIARSRDHLLIHRDVCEGCGDCVTQSSCSSLWPVQTALGRKTALHVDSCTDDRSCVSGECPAFVAIAESPPPRALDAVLPSSLPPAPVAPLGPGRFEILVAGMGSTGVVTLNAILVRAAEYEGISALHLDQTGLAQRGGRVVSHCIFSQHPDPGAARVAAGRADVCFALDPLAATDADSLDRLSRERTHALFHASLAPTRATMRDPQASLPDPEALAHQVRARSQTCTSLRAAEIADAVFGSSRTANVILLGAALQQGLLPLSVRSVEATIHDSGVAVEDNLAALRLGRAIAHDPSLVPKLLAEAEPPSVGCGGSASHAERLLGVAWTELERALEPERGAWDPARAALRGRLAAFAADLCDYQDTAYAARYARAIADVVRAERGARPDSLRLAEVAARELYRIMAYKDEFEVARLLTRGPYRRWLERRYGRPVRLRYFLDPPLFRSVLRRLGLGGKLALGAWAEPVLRLLARARVVRGSFADPFRHLPSRRLERELVDWYVAVLARIGAVLGEDNFDRCLGVAALAADVRGFEQIKQQRAERARARAESDLAALES